MKKTIKLTFLLFLFLSFFPPKGTIKAAVPQGNYLELSGGYLKAITNSAISPAGFTLEIWVKPESISGVQNIVSIGEKNSRSLHYEVGINGGSLSLNFRYGTGSQKLITAGNLNANTWNHLAVAISSTSTKLFINGSPAFATLGASPLLSLGNSIIIGNSYLEPFSSNIFRGKIDELRISNVARDVADIWAKGAYQNFLPADNYTFALWHYDEKRGESQALDSSGNNFTASLIGTDNKIHFAGALPTPTSFILPTLRFEKPIFPTLSIPNRFRTLSPTPNQNPNDNLFPTISFPFSNRPIYPR